MIIVKNHKKIDLSDRDVVVIRGRDESGRIRVEIYVSSDELRGHIDGKEFPTIMLFPSDKLTFSFTTSKEVGEEKPVDNGRIEIFGNNANFSIQKNKLRVRLGNQVFSY